MSRSDRDRLLDVLEAAEAIRQHLERGPLLDGLVFDAVRVRLIEIGEAVKDVSADVLDQQPSIPWRQVAACETTSRTATSTPRTPSSPQTVGPDLTELTTAVRALLDTIQEPPSP